MNPLQLLQFGALAVDAALVQELQRRVLLLFRQIAADVQVERQVSKFDQDARTPRFAAQSHARRVPFKVPCKT